MAPLSERLALNPIPRHTSVVEQVVTALRKAILDGSLPPDSTVSEGQCATTFGISRPTARTAIATMVHMVGLMEQRPHMPASVTNVSREELSGIFIARRVMEITVAEIIIERDDPREHLAPESSVQKSLEAFGRLPKSERTPRIIIDHEIDFHRQLAAATGNPFAEDAVASYEPKLHYGLLLNGMELDGSQLFEQHSLILGSLRYGDARAVRAMTRHLDWVVESSGCLSDDYGSYHTASSP